MKKKYLYFELYVIKNLHEGYRTFAKILSTSLPRDWRNNHVIAIAEKQGAFSTEGDSGRVTRVSPISGKTHYELTSRFAS